MSGLNRDNRQGGKEFGLYKAKWDAKLDEINKGFMDDPDYSDVDDLEFKLKEYKAKFIDCDMDMSGDLDVMDVKYLMEKMGQAKTHLEVVKMIKEVDTRDVNAINYTDFVRMLLGPKSSVLKLILLFEGLGKPQDKPTGPPPKKDLSSLP